MMMMSASGTRPYRTERGSVASLIQAAGQSRRPVENIGDAVSFSLARLDRQPSPGNQNMIPKSLAVKPK
jgi:hypothetical protein